MKLAARFGNSGQILALSISRHNERPKNSGEGHSK